MPPAPLPAELVALAREYDEGGREPVAPRDAATVVLMRDGSGGPAGGLEVYLLRRHTSMEFAAGMAVFPGGGVDARDFDASVGWAGPSPQEWAQALGCEPDLARALVCAAVRETFEESGVLLAGASADEVVGDTTGEDWEADRAALESRDLALTAFLERRGLVLRTDLLAVWDAWLTPAFEPRRYRTWFFAASLPEGQVTRDVSTESSSVTWTAAGAAVDAADAGELMLMPPTYLNCLAVAQHVDAASALDSARDRRVTMHCPSVEPLGEEHVLSMPDHLRPLVAARAARTSGSPGSAS